ncbi:predicted protein [Nematostella vectensis]|uniref:Histamine N-methyltransferase n=1 Tax=Nematostella vectensis TaxID=45351 RepID=A7RUD4_NEMVE|nr:predicted protein [Nematostella vectensis]|eukprot:XP_001636898.1 predicted protein [Nematostella vectensis]
MSSFDFNWYRKCFEGFNRNSTERSAVINCLKEKLPSMLERIGKSTKEEDPFRILTIGGGMGQIDMEILHIIAAFFKQKGHDPVYIASTAVDPNGSMLGEYKKAVKNLPSSLLSQASIKVDFQQKTFEEYVKSCDGAKYDLVYFIHSIHYTDPDASIPLCYGELLASQGVFFSVTASTDNTFIHTDNKVN